MSIDSRLPNFRAMDPAQRLDEIVAKVGLNAAERALLADAGGLPLETANGMIENVISKFELPYAVAGYFQINGRDVLVPMVVEEPSVVAAASFMAKLIRESGGFQTSSTGPLMRAQVQIMGLSDPFGARHALLMHRQEIIDIANSRDKVLIGLGGGCKDIEVHVFPDTARGAMVVMHLIVDVRDAMGANTVNTMAEAVAGRVEAITGGKVRLRILSNLADLRLARARVQLSPELLKSKDYSGEEVINGILDAYTFAAVDPYRAATHNKGIMNGIDPVIVATGNDWRAVEAGAHAYACRGGHYTSLTTWELAANGDLVGTIEMPMPVGLVGGATKTHPMAQLSLKILQTTSAQDLAEVAVAVGLAQNLGALRALSTEGIQRGHMALHARNIAIAAGAKGQDVDWVVREMVAVKDVRVDFAVKLLADRQ
ncbi:hydroxymethylglutaryl-CoA reductase, degradative [Herbaspirillum sp. RTI4]|uniref:hydroxymethylglutaryl-CoA reductase, degradative n=1 Tax=Herbaspirillum sp. RTI4 TaxID=3048640 RepID=UPI002AB575F8|nr:hydroxymethylglutaryl-CoA reductase, degradative [Herbaspirillum sp. RTI4]MDY7579175.1 hydroxymethylglutaryl-CoA reductase, degradative [Herbaspirillum sp. RTI4]MEA9983223.1 hydroxymethylglutaryl-CoA reductase, degradative [Herbaspirillum sp. RTI4]